MRMEVINLALPQFFVGEITPLSITSYPRMHLTNFNNIKGFY
jgi:hypothetical protein